MDNKRPTASDIDGTFNVHPEIRGEVDFLVTGNTWQDWEHVKEDSDGLPVYLNPGRTELMDIVTHKANVLNKMNVEKFYENDSAQVALLKAMCPKTRIVQVSFGRTAI